MKANYKTKLSPIKTGDVVKLNYDKLINNVDFNKFSTKYVKWINEHKDSVFITKEDIRLKNHFILCNKETNESSLFIFSPYDLSKYEN